jgi:hypothetical protein
LVCDLPREPFVAVGARIEAGGELTEGSARLQDPDVEIDRVVVLQNPDLAHPHGTPHGQPAVEGMLLALKAVANPEVVLFLEPAGQAIGWFPAAPNLNEIVIELGGLRRP